MRLLAAVQRSTLQHAAPRLAKLMCAQLQLFVRPHERSDAWWGGWAPYMAIATVGMHVHSRNR